MSARSLKVSVVTVRIEPFGPLPGAVLVETGFSLGRGRLRQGPALILRELVSCVVRRWSLRFLGKRDGWNRHQSEAGERAGEI